MVPHVATMLGTSARKAASSRSAEVAIDPRIKKSQQVTRVQPIGGCSFVLLPLSVAAARTPQSKSFLGAVFGDGGSEEPLFQHGGKLRAGLAEGHADAETGL